MDFIESGIGNQLPELMSSEKLINALRERKVIRNEDDTSCYDKDTLVKLYARFILPLPQRKQLRRGQSKRHVTEMKKCLEKYSRINRKYDRGLEESEDVYTEESAKEQTNQKEIRKCDEPEDEYKKDIQKASRMRILARESEQKRKPIKLKRKHSNSKDDIKAKKEAPTIESAATNSLNIETH